MPTYSIEPAIPQLPSASIETTKTFYLGKLGFEIVAEYPGQKFLIVKKGNAEIHFWQTDESAAERPTAMLVSIEYRKGPAVRLDQRSSPRGLFSCLPRS